MLLLIDENVPRSVALFLRDRGHEVRFVNDLFPAGVPDPAIATYGNHLSAIVVTWDKDFSRLVRRIPEGNRERFRKLGRITFSCNETRGRRLVERWVETIEFHYDQVRKHPDFRMIVQIQENGIKLM
jgi:predicted nuclease of predicted toxin-antitoxin system